MSEEVTTEINKYGEEVEICRFDKYRHTNGGLYAFIECPISCLDIEMPSGANWCDVIVTDAEYDEVGEITLPAVIRQKTILEFVAPPTYSLDGTKCFFRAAGMIHPSYRQHAVGKDDLDDWCYFKDTALNGAELLNIDEMRIVLSGEEYR